MQFNGLIRQDNVYSDSVRTEVSAKGIGWVIRIYSNNVVWRAIYYRVNGATDGSLAGTPFGTGELLDGKFF